MKTALRITQCLFFKKKAKYKMLVFIFEIIFCMMIEDGTFVDCKVGTGKGSLFLFIDAFLLKYFVLLLIVLYKLCSRFQMDSSNTISMLCIFCSAFDLCSQNLHLVEN